MKKIILFLFLSIIFSNEGDRTFHLKSGDKITGKIVDETDSIYKIQTTFVILEIDKNDIKPDEVSITLKSGDKITGILIDESETENSKIISQQIIITCFNSGSYYLPPIVFNENKKTDGQLSMRRLELK